MRLDLNLASQPYEDARQFWMRWGTAVGAVGLLTLLLLALTVTGWFNARRDHKAMAEKRALIAERDQVRANAEEFLNRPENRTTRDTSQFLNELIERKAFSWTRVLENLEKVMPARVHLVSINPGLDEDNQLSLKMTVAGDSRERAIELAQRMEDSKRFAQTNIMSGRSTQSTTGDTEQFDIAAIYIPEPATATDAGTANPAAPNSTKEATPKDATGAEGPAEVPPAKPKKAPIKPPTKTAPRSLAQGQGQGQGANH
ncbi:MAG: PilN domain-containing protein [Candidatus Sulfotelmatobacter sp.]